MERFNRYQKKLHNEIFKICLNKNHHFAKISYYCYILELLIKNNNRYLNYEIINRLDRYDNYDEFNKIEYLDPYISIPSLTQSNYLKLKLVILLKVFLQY